jgi:hypothetical protein
VEADEDGTYTPPEGATGDLFETWEEALEECPPPMLTLACGTPTRFPQTLHFTLTDLTGDFVGLWDANSYPVPMTPVLGPGGGASGTLNIVDANGVTWRITIVVACSDPCPAFGEGFGVQAFLMAMLFQPITENTYGLSEYCSFGSWENGWSTSVFGLGPFKSETCRLASHDPLIAAPERLVTYRTNNPGFPPCGLAGTYSIWLSA